MLRMPLVIGRDRESKYGIYNNMAIELEVGEFLFGLVRIMRPSLVIESGSGEGVSGSFIARALMENDYGKMVGFEPQRAHYEIAWKRLNGLPVELHNEHMNCDVAASLNPDIVFIDSDSEVRVAEIEYWKKIKSTTLIVHDAMRQEYHLKGGWMFPVPIPRDPKVSARGLWVRPRS